MATSLELVEDESPEARLDAVFSRADEILGAGEVNADQASLSVALDDDFFRLLQSGLCSKVRASRKKALYLLKRCIDSGGRGVAADNAVFTGASASADRKLWDDYFLVLETVEEKQVHIVKQVAPKLNRLAQAVDDDGKGHLHYTWYLAIFDLLFRHQNTAIAKWSVRHFLQTFAGILEAAVVTSDRPDFLAFVLGPLLASLNNSKLYEKAAAASLAHNLQAFLSACQGTTGTQDESRFFNGILDGVFRVSWSPIALYHVTAAVRKAFEKNASALLTPETAARLDGFVSVSMHCQEPLLKCGSQCNLLAVLISHSEAKASTADDDDDWLAAAQRLKTFHGPGRVLVRGTELWRRAADWAFHSDSDSRDEEGRWYRLWKRSKHSREAVDRLAMLAVMAADRGKKGQDSLLSRVQQDLRDGACRPYNEDLSAQLHFLCCVARAKEARTARREGRGFLVYGRENRVESQLELDAVLREPLEALLEREDEQVFLDALFLLVRVCGQGGEAEQLVEREAKKVLEAAAVGLEGLTRSLEVLDAFAEEGAASAVGKHLAAEVCLKRELPNLNFGSAIDRMEKSRNVNLQWRLLGTTIEAPSSSPFRVVAADDLVEKATRSVEEGDGDALAHVLNVAAACLAREVGGDVASLLRAGRSAVFDQRKNERFWPSLEGLCRVVSSGTVVAAPAGSDTTVEAEGIVDSLMKEAEVVPGIAYTLAAAVKGWVDPKGQRLPRWMMDLLVRLLIFGPLFRKDLQTVMDNNVMVQKDGDPVLESANVAEGSDHGVDAMTRAAALNFATRMQQRHLEDLADLLTSERSACRSSVRYFENSHLHLAKHRSLQTLLVISPLLSAAASAELFRRVSLSVVEDSQQQSVRYYSEWIMARLLAAHPGDTEGPFREAFSAAKSRRPACAASFLTARTAAVLQLSDMADDDDVPERSSLLGEALSLVAPWCMAQHFATRTCAQVCVLNLWEKVEGRGGGLEAAWKSLAGSVRDSLDLCGDGEKNRKRISSDFYLSSFDPASCFNLRDAFREMPRLCGLVAHEWENFDLAHGGMDWRHLRQETPLGEDSESVLAGVAGGIADKKEFELGDNEEEDEGGAIQKKITPWKDMFDTRDKSKRRARFPGLCVVGSLVDKLPNLGGLCRTCEVFGAGQFVVLSSRQLQDREFAAVSVTAHQWVDVAEAPAAGGQLSAFLEAKRREGFSVVAAEQATGSVSLADFSFPEKTVLLLGNEKEGLPADMLRAVDRCVEIPQHGLVRSLNVHVTGAVMIWEYVRQWSDDKKKTL